MKRLEKFLRTRIKNLRKGVKGYVRSPDADTLHEIRVDIKKIKAALNCIACLNKGFDAHDQFKKFRPIFRAAGAIREPAVIAALMRQYRVDGAASGPRGIKGAELKFVGLAPDFLRVIRQKGKPVARNASRITKKDFARYIQQQLDSAHLALHPRVLTGQLHKTRKTIKEIVYLSGVNDSLEPRTLRFFKELEERIGNWHDKQTILAFLGSKHRAARRLQDACREDEKAIAKLAGGFYR